MLYLSPSLSLSLSLSVSPSSCSLPATFCGVFNPVVSNKKYHWINTFCKELFSFQRLHLYETPYAGIQSNIVYSCGKDAGGGEVDAVALRPRRPEPLPLLEVQVLDPVRLGQRRLLRLPRGRVGRAVDQCLPERSVSLLRKKDKVRELFVLLIGVRGFVSQQNDKRHINCRLY